MPASHPRTRSLEDRRDIWRRLIIVLFAAIVTIPAVMKSRQSRSIAAPAAFSVLSSAKGYVRISGDVRHPGIYPLTDNTVTGSVILLAEPFRTPAAYAPAGCERLSPVNGTEIRVLIDGNGTARIVNGSIPTEQRLVLGIPLDINSMDEADFDHIPGIGPVLAKRIVAYRHDNDGFLGPKDLIYIDGIGEKKFERLKKYFK